MKNYFPLSTHHLFGFRLDSFTILIKALRTVSPFLPFEGLTHAYLMKTCITHNRYLIFFSFEDSDSISAKSAAHMLYLNLAYTFLLFLITGLCNSLASRSFTLILDPVFFYQKLIDHTC